MKTPTPVFGVDCTGNYEWTGQSTLSNCGRVLAGAYSTGGGSDALGRWCAGSDIGDNTCGSVAAGYYSTGGGTSATPNGPRDGCLEDYNCGLVRGGYYSTGAGMREYGSCNNRLGFMCGEIEGGYYSSAGGTSATPNGPGDGCVAGQRCGECGDANYCPNASSAPTACPTGLTTCGLGMCANEAGDCGKKLHAGDKVIHLRSEKRTTPSLNFKLGNQVFYGNLVDVIADSLRVRNGDKNYSVVSDNQ